MTKCCTVISAIEDITSIALASKRYRQVRLSTIGIFWLVQIRCHSNLEYFALLTTVPVNPVCRSNEVHRKSNRPIHS